VNLDGRSALITGRDRRHRPGDRAGAGRARRAAGADRAAGRGARAAGGGGRRPRGACDLASAAEVTRLLGECSNADVLVANAALPATGVLESFSVEEIDRALDVNLRAPIVLARALSKGMVARSHGHLVFVSSLSGKAASARGSIYSATKFGLRGFALGLRRGPAGHGRRRLDRLPRLHQRRGDVPRVGREAAGYVAMKTPKDVAAAVVRAIERNRAEIDVAPLGLRLGTAVAGCSRSCRGA
jgi:NADP-dependent 3-hydroxy acid dehydrogenase YdfG